MINDHSNYIIQIGVKIRDFHHVKEILTRNWRTSLKLYNLLLSKREKFNEGFSEKNLMDILKRNEISSENKTTLHKIVKPLKKFEFIREIKKGSKTTFWLVET